MGVHKPTHVRSCSHPSVVFLDCCRGSAPTMFLAQCATHKSRTSQTTKATDRLLATPQHTAPPFVRNTPAPHGPTPPQRPAPSSNACSDPIMAPMLACTCRTAAAPKYLSRRLQKAQHWHRRNPQHAEQNRIVGFRPGDAKNSTEVKPSRPVRFRRKLCCSCRCCCPD